MSTGSLGAGSPGAAGSGPVPAGSGDPLAAAEDRLEQIAPGYLARVRAAAEAMSVGAHGGGGVAAEVAAVREAGKFDLDVPTRSATPAVSYVKAGVKRATSWYLRYLSGQLEGFAAAVVSLAEATASELDRLERVAAGRDRELEELRARLERLEARAGGAGGPAGRAEGRSAGGLAGGPAGQGARPAAGPHAR